MKIEYEAITLEDCYNNTNYELICDGDKQRVEIEKKDISEVLKND